MGNLEADTSVAGGEGRYTATLSTDWQIWGPMGGYLASIALRASAREVSPDLAPASLTCQFVSVAEFAPVDVDVAVVRASSRVALVSSSVSQEGRAILHAQSWFAAESDLVQHDHVPRHRYGHPDDHPPISAYALKDPPRPFWNNFDRRPLDFVEDWSSFPGSEPVWAEWLRFTVPQFDDTVVEACRLILLADLPSFPAAARAHPRDSHTWIAPSLDLAVQFHRLDALGEWLLVRGTAPIAERGLIGFRSEVWDATGRLAASGSGQCLCRPLPPAS